MSRGISRRVVQGLCGLTLARLVLSCGEEKEFQFSAMYEYSYARAEEGQAMIIIVRNFVFRKYLENCSFNRKSDNLCIAKSILKYLTR